VATKKSIKQRILEILSENVGNHVTSDFITKTLVNAEWGRSLRTLRAEGWDISDYDHSKKGYVLKSLEKSSSTRNRESISQKLRYQILFRDNSTCQRCGKTPKDGVKLHVDHKTPVDWGGDSSESNLWTLCESCNLGKKNLFSELDKEIMSEVLKEPSAHRKIKRYFELRPNVPVTPTELSIISGIRDWTRTLRLVRQKEKMDLKWISKDEDYPEGYYIFNSTKEV
jgi:hypothetical protein